MSAKASGGADGSSSTSDPSSISESSSREVRSMITGFLMGLELDVGDGVETLDGICLFAGSTNRMSAAYKSTTLHMSYHDGRLSEES